MLCSTAPATLYIREANCKGTFAMQIDEARTKVATVTSCYLPLFTALNGAPGAIPTRDLPLRRRTLYATELREPKRQTAYSKQ